MPLWVGSSGGLGARMAGHGAEDRGTLWWGLECGLWAGARLAWPASGRGVGCPQSRWQLRGPYV